MELQSFLEGNKLVGAEALDSIFAKAGSRLICSRILSNCEIIEWRQYSTFPEKLLTLVENVI